MLDSKKERSITPHQTPIDDENKFIKARRKRIEIPSSIQLLASKSGSNVVVSGLPPIIICQNTTLVLFLPWQESNCLARGMIPQ